MALDYNADKEGHAKKKWMVIKAVKDQDFKGVEIDGKMMKFGKDGAFRVSDPAVANAIRQKVGMTATVTGFRHPDAADGGHTYFFGCMPAMPWHKYDEYGNRIIETEDTAEEVEEEVGEVEQ